MKKLKFIFISCFVLVFALSSCIICFADVNNEYTLKEFLTIDDAAFSVYRVDQNGIPGNSNSYWVDDNALGVTGASSSAPGYIAYGLNIWSGVPGDEPIFSVERNDFFSFSCDEISYSFLYDNSSIYPEYFRLTITFTFNLKDGTTKDVTIIDESADSIMSESYVGHAYFNDLSYNFSFPTNFVSLQDIDILVSSAKPSNANGGITFRTKPITLYIGDKSGAPIYNAPNDSNQNVLDQQEEQLRNNADEGFNKFSGLFSSFEDLFSPTSDFFVGATFITALLNRFIIGIPGLNSLLILSLTLGLLLFIVGSVGYIGASISSNRVRSVERAERSAYRRSAISANNAKRDYFRRK